ncbi:hypothetical protein GQ53DRAFT_822805 [Thozetella sp. PMI_491]|nr:hypothetical protein GQ53DRAFT_822805 [Thozetella sp. PMI_491]
MDLCAIPAGIPPDGVIPDFENPPSLAPAMIATITILSAASVSITFGRLYANRRRLHISDYVMLIGLIFSWGMSVTCLLLLKFARHQWDIPVCWLDASYMKKLFATTIIIPLGSIFPKSAILILYIQVFSSKEWMRPAVYLGLLFNFFTYAPLIGAAVYYTTPRGGTTWAELALSTEPQRGLYMSTVKAAMSVVANFYILILPLPILTKLQMGVSKKVQLITVFATASIGVIASIVDLAYCVKLLDLEDSTWSEASVSITTIVENNVAIIVGSMPAFANFFKVQVVQSNSFQSFRSRFSKKGLGTSDFHSDPHTPIRTFGSSGQKQHHYYELDENALLRSQCTSNGEVLVTPGMPDGGIVRTVGVYQQNDSAFLKNP